MRRYTNDQIAGLQITILLALGMAVVIGVLLLSGR